MNSKFYIQKFQFLEISSKILIALFTLNIFITTYGQTNKQNYFNYIQAWAQADTFNEHRLSRSALEQVNKIYNQAKSDNFTEQIIKCILVREYLNNTIDNDPLNSINTLKSEINSATFPIKPVLYSLIAEKFKNYYDYNSYKIAQRSDVITNTNDSVVFWSKSQFQNEIIRYLKLSLRGKEKLQQIPIELINEVVNKEMFYGEGKITLYDLLAQRALELLNNYYFERNTKPVQKMLNNPSVFGSVNTFLGIPISTTDTSSTIYLSLKLYQELLRFHKNDIKPDLLLSYNMERLQYLKEYSVLDNKDSLFNKALKNLRNEYFTHPISAEIDYLFAIDIYNHGSRQKAINLCQNSIVRFKNIDKVPGVCKCQTLIANIKQPALDINYEPINIPDEPSKVKISYNNINHLYVLIFPVSIDEAIQIERGLDTSSVNFIFETQFAKRKYIKNFDILLPKNQDYESKSAEILIPSLTSGYYYIWFSDNSKFNNSDITQYITDYRSDIIFAHRTLDRKTDQIYVFNRKTGLPLTNAIITTYTTTIRKNHLEYSKDSTFTSNTNGFVQIPVKNEYDSYQIDINTENSFFSNRLNSPISHSSRYFHEFDKHKIFTDRKIYRPGQTIYFKGIYYDRKSYKEAYTVRNRTIDVWLSDRNGKNLAEQALKTNEYGSYNGTFSAPLNCLNGIFTIHDNKGGETFVRIEEYKRPKFEVIIDSLEGIYRLGDIIPVTGRALTYSNTSVDKAKVHYVITCNGQTILSDNTVTGHTGEFSFKFKALSKEKLDINQFSRCYFEVKVEITDMNGETHEAEKTFILGYRTLEIKANIPEKIDKTTFHSFDVWAKNLTGKNIPSELSITITKLKNPEKAYKERLWDLPDTILISKTEFTKYFPKDIYQKQSNPLLEDREKKILQTKIKTSQTARIKLNDLSNWPMGRYLIELHSKDKFGQLVNWSQNFILYSSKDSILALPKIDEFKLITPTVESGDTARILVGSSDQIFALLEIEKDDSIIHQFRIELNNRQKSIPIPITKDYVGGVAVHYIFAKDNRLYEHSEIIKVPYSNKKLNISFVTFRNKLYPGEKEEWKIKISGPEHEKVAAEMLATLYDASLDVFVPNNFRFNVFRNYSPSLTWKTYCFEKTKESNSAIQYLFQPNYKSNYLPFVQLISHYLSDNKEKIKESTVTVFSFKPQSTLEIDGIVVDGYNGMALSGAQLSFAGFESSVFSDTNGKFSFKASVKKAKLFINKPGFQKVAFETSGKMRLLVKLANNGSIEQTKWICNYEGELLKVPISFNATCVVNEPSAMFCSMAGSSFETEDESGNRLLALKTNNALTNVVPRSNFNETAFFHPNLIVNEQGEIVISFTIPESITRWKMLGFAHTNDLKTGNIENELVTRKELMVYPNFPRFFREGDTLKLMTRIANLTDTSMVGDVKLMLFDAVTMQPIDSISGNFNKQSAFSAKENQSTATGWIIHIPSGIEAVVCRIVASSGKFSDGEEVIIPVLSNSIFVTESLPIFVKGKQNRTFTLNKLLQNKSTTLRNHKLSFEYSANPAWYAILSLPYLMEFPFECSEQTFSRYYANNLGNFILQSDPKIKAVLDSWKSLPSEQLSDNLEQNQELKALLLEETPWLRESKNGEACLHQLSTLFDKVNLNKELEKCLAKLMAFQNNDGGFPWFPGMPSNRYITQHIVAGIGHLRKIKGIKSHKFDLEESILSSAIDFIDRQLWNDYKNLTRLNEEKNISLEENHLTELAIHCLYARSFFDNFKITNTYVPAYEYYLSQVKKYWADEPVYFQGMIALILKREGIDFIPGTIIESLRERAIISEEQGMHWQNDCGYYWYQAPIEIQSLLIEAFSEVGIDKPSIEEMKLWLLQQKHTQNWHSTKATTEAIYALLLNGTNWLTIEPDITVSVGDEMVLPVPQDKPQPQAGTGYIKTTWDASKIIKDMGTVKIESRSDGVSWGALYWQYFEKLENTTPASTPLSIRKILLKEQHTPKGNAYYPVTDTTKLKPGDLLKVRLEIITDRDLEYVHLKDMHAEGLEPLNALSEYKWQGGLDYYESPRDAATHFFISFISKGAYVFEYPLRITMSGNLSNGIATIQCMYAPEFSAHSGSVRLKIK